MRIDILKKGDEFVGIFGNMIAVRKASGEVELTAVILDEHNCIRLEEGRRSLSAMETILSKQHQKTVK